MQPTLAELASEHEKEIRWGFKDMPLSGIHPDALRAAQAGRCTDEQGKSWEFRAKLFEQDSFTDETYTDLATELRIKLDPLLERMNSGKHENAVMPDFNEARSYGIDGTPAFLINGVLLTGAQRIETFRHAIDRELGVDVIPCGFRKLWPVFSGNSGRSGIAGSEWDLGCIMFWGARPFE